MIWSEGPKFTSTGVTTDAKIVVATSLDGGVTFGAPVTVANINSLRQDPPVGYNRDRLNDHPRIAVATTGSTRLPVPERLDESSGRAAKGRL